MAGIYPDVPGQKIAYDIDGSVGVFVTDTGATPYSNAVLAAFNDNVHNINQELDAPGVGSATAQVAIIFPQPRTIRGVWATMGRGSTPIGSPPILGPFQYSTDTTNGQDGTWVDFTTAANDETATWAVNGVQSSGVIEPNSRNDILAVTPIPNVRSVRLEARAVYLISVRWGTIYLFGEVTTPEYLEIVNPTTHLQIGGADFDWGDIPQGTSEDRTFRVKNFSTTHEAGGVAVSFDDNTPPDTPTPESWHGLSLDGVNFSPTVSLGSLAPGAVSQVVTLRRATPNNAQLGLTELRIAPSATMFTEV